MNNPTTVADLRSLIEDAPDNCEVVYSSEFSGFADDYIRCQVLGAGYLLIKREATAEPDFTLDMTEEVGSEQHDWENPWEEE